MTKLTEVKFEVVYETLILRKVGELMSKLDLGIDGLSNPKCMHVSWKTTTKVNAVYIRKMEEKLKTFLESDGLCIISLKKL